MTFKGRTLDLINAARAAAGIGPVAVSTALESVAQDREFSGCDGIVVQGRSTDMGLRNYFSHAIKDCGNRGFTHMLDAANITRSGAGENIGFMNGTTDEDVAAENIHNRFMAEPPNQPNHRGNVLNPSFTHVGIGVFRSFNLPWSGGPGNQPLINAFVTCQIFAANPSSPGVMDTTGASYHPVTPSRVLDTRIPIGAPTAAKLGPGATLLLQVTGAGGVPASGVSAVVLNLTVTDPTAGGFLTVFPAGGAMPVASNLNFTPGVTVANLVAVKLSATGQVSIFNSAGATHVIADVAGWFDGGGAAATGSRFHPLTPGRILDSRVGLQAGAPVGPGGTLDVAVLNRGGVPAAGVAAVAVNVTAVSPTSAGFLTVFPTGEPRPLASNLNFAAGQTTPNLVVAKIGAGGSISVFNASGSTHVVADVGGWFDQGGSSGSTYHPVTPSRILDTRVGNGAPAGPLGAAATLPLQVTGVGGVPVSGVAAVVLNVTVAGPTAQSFLTVFPAGESRPNASNLFFVAGQVVPGLVVAKVGVGGTVSIFNDAGTTHVIADVAGWFDAG